MTARGGPRVLVWRSSWLAYSETFIRFQARALERHVPVFRGLMRVTGSRVEPGDLTAFGSSRRARARFRLFQTVRRSLAVDRLIRRADAGVVHIHFATDAAAIAPTLQRLGIPYLVTTHGYDVTASAQPGRRGRRRAEAVRHALAGSRLVMAVSEPIARASIAAGAPADRTVVHHLGIPVPARRPSRPTEWDIVFVGRLVEKKGVGILLDALAVLEARLGPLRVAIVGDGPLRGSLEARSAVLQSRVTFTGPRTPEAVLNTMAAAVLLALPAVTSPTGETEGLPTVLVEAAALGVPAVATRHSGIPEIVRDGVTGLLVAEHDVAGLADALAALLQDREMRARMSAAARRLVEEEFDIVARTAELERYYDVVAADRPRPTERSRRPTPRASHDET